MAFYDNKLWLLSHIHNSFISSDDSSVCETILSSGNFKEELRVIANHQGLPSFTECISDEEDEDTEGYRGSPDLRGGGANRSESAAADDKPGGAKPEKHKPQPAASKTVVWKASNLESEEMESMFPKKQIPDKDVPKTSLLSRLVENPTVSDFNPWLEFGRFDATGNAEQKFVRRILMYFPMTVGEKAMKPISISCGREARVCDLIGLSCCVYTQEVRQPRLQPPADNYSLFMCEEDGTVDVDFPALDPNDLLNKYGFQILALVEKTLHEPRVLCVTLHMPDGTFSQIEVQRKDMTLGELMDKGLERRKFLTNVKHNFGYHMEAADAPGIGLDLKVALNVNGGEEFYVVRNNSKRVSGPRDAPSSDMCFLEAPLFQSFNVEIFTKVRTKVDVHLGVSGDKVEIDPKHQSSSAKFWSKQKAVSYALDIVVSCEILEKRQRGDRVCFRMVYLSDSGWGQRDFEADSLTAAEVVQKLNYLLDLRQSTARKQRKEYLLNKEKKKERPRTVTK